MAVQSSKSSCSRISRKLRDAGLTVNDLAKVVGENVENAGGGIVNAGNEQLVIRGVGRVVSRRRLRSCR